MKWVAGWNMPGYLPETDPALFDSRDEAVTYLADTMDRWAGDFWGDDSGREEIYSNLAAALEHDNREGATHEVLHIDQTVNIAVWARLAESEESYP